MMSSTTSQRAGRAPKDKVKTQQPHSAAKVVSEVAKPAETIVSKIQPTAEQLRIAQIVNDAHKMAYPDLKDKVERIIEITGGTCDAALVALHDCDNDTNRAAIMLLEGNQEEGKWETSGKKKKNRQPPKAPEVNGHEPPSVEKEEKEPVENPTRKREPKPRDGGYRYRGPPRMNRGNQGRNWRNKENEKNERNLRNEDEGKRYRNFEGRSRGPRRGRGRGGRSRTFQNRGLQNDGFPESIDTWTNSTAERVNSNNTGDGTMTVGNWSDIAVTEEWSEEDWTEALTETKVFTPSAGTQSSAAVLDMPSSTALAQNLDLASFLQKASSNSESGTQQTLNGISQQGSSSMMSQQMTSQIPQNVVPQSQAHFDFNQAAESIKAAVGVVTAQNSSTPSMNANNSYQSSSGNYQSNYSSVNSGNSQHHVNLSHDLQQVIVSQPGYPSSSPGVPQGVHMPRDMHSAVISQSSSISSAKTTATSSIQPLPPRAKPSKARLPPPSKIPESAVVMPDDAVTSLDVQFGALQFGTDSSPFDFTSENSTPYQEISQSSNAPSHATNQSISSSITSHTLSNALPSSVSMTKDSTYSIGSHGTTNQNSVTSDLSQSQKVSTQDSILLSQGEHKAVDSVSSYVSHRSNQPSVLDGSMMSSKPHQPSAMSSYSSSSHDNSSAYSTNPYASQKSVLNTSSLVPSTVGYTHTPSSLNNVSNDLTNSQQQSKYQSQVTQSQNSSYVTGSSMQSSPYAMQSAAYSGSSTTSGSTYPSQTGYSSHATGNYVSNSGGYSSQQSVYSGAVATTTQSGTLLSTSVSASKLTNSLAHVVKDSGLLESQHGTSQHAYDVPSTTSSSNVLSANSLASTSGTNHSSQNSTNMNSVLGLVSTSSSTTTTSVLKNSLSASKTVPNIPQNMPVLGHQYIMGQASLPFYGLQQPVYSYEDMQMLQSKLSTLGLQSPVYSYEDMQMLQSKLSTLGYYDMQFQAPTSMTGRDPGMGNVAYTVADGKYSRADTDASSVATTLSQGQANTQAHGQAFLNPAAALPPGYGYYFAGGMMTGGIHHYAPPIFPVPSATNTHGATTSTQFQKTGYGSHSYANSGYESLTQAQDYSKGTYGAASQNQVKGVSGSGAVSDLSGSVYSKTLAHAKSYEKPGFHTGTPPPFNLAGSQATGAMGASSGPYATQFIPVLAHGQHHSTALLHHHMQQDTTQTGGTPTAGQRGPQGLGQQKNSSKQSYPYWTNN